MVAYEEPKESWRSDVGQGWYPLGWSRNAFARDALPSPLIASGSFRSEIRTIGFGNMAFW